MKEHQELLPGMLFEAMRAIEEELNLIDESRCAICPRFASPGCAVHVGGVLCGRAPPRYQRALCQ